MRRQARRCADERGRDWTFEALLAAIASRVIQHFQPRRERCRVAEGDDGDIAGTVCVVRLDDDTARLRRLQLGVGTPDMRSCFRKKARASATSWFSLGWSTVS